MISILILLPILLAITVGIPALIGVYVYRDATRRGMNAALWTLVAILSPVLIGFIVYLLARGSYSDMKCPSCNSTVTEQYTVCPRCGAKLRATCNHCGCPVEPDWSVCPKCATPLEQEAPIITPPIQRPDRGLSKILAIVILVPLALLFLLIIFSFIQFSGGYSTAVSRLAVEQYDPNSEITAWMRQCDENSDATYALRYTSSQGASTDKDTTYLIYRPNVSSAMDCNVTPKTGIFKKELQVNIVDTDEAIDTNLPLTCITHSGKDYLKELTLYINGERVSCQITPVTYNPAVSNFALTG